MKETEYFRMRKEWIYERLEKEPFSDRMAFRWFSVHGDRCGGSCAAGTAHDALPPAGVLLPCKGIGPVSQVVYGNDAVSEASGKLCEGPLHDAEDKVLSSVVRIVIITLRALPPLLLALFFLSLFGSSFSLLVVVLFIPRLPALTLIAEKKITSLMKEEYVLSSSAMGMPRLMLFHRHIIPHLLPVMFNQGILVFFSVLLTESSLSFLGFGLSGKTPTFGYLMNEGMEYLLTFPHMMLFPAIFLFLPNIVLQYPLLFVCSIILSINIRTFGYNAK